MGQHYMCNNCPKMKKLNPWPPKPLNIDIRQSLLSNRSIESPKKIPTQQHYFCQFLLNLTKVMLLCRDFILEFHWIRCSKVTVLYLYLVVWGVMDWAFSIWGSYCTYSVDLCHFSWFLAQLSPPANFTIFAKLRKYLVEHDRPSLRVWKLDADLRSSHKKMSSMHPMSSA